MSKYLDQEGVQALWSKIKDRDTKRDNYFNYKDEFIPLNGQICFVDTAIDGLQIKVGDGETPWSDLPFLTASENIAGLVRMYSSTGENTDGTITQKAITDALKLKVGLSFDEENETIKIL